MVDAGRIVCPRRSAHGPFSVGRDRAVRGQEEHEAALRCGATVDEIRDALVHVAAYCGAPTARQAFLAAHAGLREAGALP
ncbi:MAG TPA: carboxymuconolactone decarboxylase family protein [Candidatus Binatia bacterium]|nr:carboxymuconolactone decarboxylase family protein [Candidatus Binatia bacterium]